MSCHRLVQGTVFSITLLESLRFLSQLSAKQLIAHGRRGATCAAAGNAWGSPAFMLQVPICHGMSLTNRRPVRFRLALQRIRHGRRFDSAISLSGFGGAGGGSLGLLLLLLLLLFRSRDL